MNFPLSAAETARQAEPRVGGKALTLARLAAAGFAVPTALCLPVEVYRNYLQVTDLDARIAMELGRKEFSAMRWEELWDAALRIRHLFLTTPLPGPMARRLDQAIQRTFGERALAVRSSAPGEDSAGASFAGLHESLVNVRGPEAACEAVRKVWASLWSDRALLYRQELGLDVHHSAMAVLIQELVSGEKSGVAFSRSPSEDRRTVIEAVWGLNQGLVDGSIEPDHWQLDRTSGDVLEFRPARRQQALRPVGDGVRAVDLPPAQAGAAPLNRAELAQVVQLARRLEHFFGVPQDVEWTFCGEQLVLLQSRAVTGRRQANGEDQRGWYLSLHRSLRELQQLRRQLEDETLPGMEAAAAELAAIDLAALDEKSLAGEIERRRRMLAEWQEVYRQLCIPMAHGVRLFGEFYNDGLHPEDPFAFVQLLQGAGMGAVARNRRLGALAAELKRQPAWRRALAGGGQLPPQLAQCLEPLAESTGLAAAQLGRLLLQLAQQDAATPVPVDRLALEAAYLEGFEQGKRAWAAELLELGRASYRLRDDDNLSLDKIRRQLQRAEAEGKRRIAAGADHAALRKLLTEAAGPVPKAEAQSPRLRVRQLQGQPAGPGLARGRARVVNGPEDLAAFRAGEILVCDAIDPAMTFVVPLAAGIVERRGGMLIHGAIIAREYGLPCVTGIPDPTRIIRNGDRVTVDGYLGIVVIDRGA